MSVNSKTPVFSSRAEKIMSMCGTKTNGASITSNNPKIIPIEEQQHVTEVIQSSNDQIKNNTGPAGGEPSCSYEIQSQILTTVNQIIFENDLELSSDADDTSADNDYSPSSTESTSESDNETKSIKRVNTKAGRNDQTVNTEVEKITRTKTNIIQEGKKRQRYSDQWICNQRKMKHLAGETYENKQGKEVRAKIMQPPCSCRMKCHERISEDDRKIIFNSYWDHTKTHDMKRQFIRCCIEVKPKERSRGDGTRPKKNSIIYHFTVNNVEIRVCKLMFLNTLCISNTVVVNTMKKQGEYGFIEPDQRGRHTPVTKTPSEVIENVIKHIQSVPSYSSHYTRERSNRKFLSPDLTLQKMYSLYLEFCEEQKIDQKNIAKKWLNIDIFHKKFNLSFKPTSHDTCDTCDSYIAQLKGELNSVQRNSLQTDFDLHISDAKQRYNMKSSDAEIERDSKHKVLTVDLQKCLPTPLLTNSLTFYKRKLWTFNFTLFDLSDGYACNMMWDETKAGRGGNEIASAIKMWADYYIPNSETEVITFWSDNCYGQNKNMSVFLSFFYILHKYPQIRCINHKFLLNGHTHMEADTVHALIERKRKKMDSLTVLTPRDWQQLVRQCSKKYKVFNMEVNDFKDFKSLYHTSGSPFIFRKLDINKKPFTLSKCVHLQVKQCNAGRLYVKNSFNDEDFIEVNCRRNVRKDNVALPQELSAISETLRPISTAKYNDLISLLPFIPSECHPFYKNIPYQNDTYDYPTEDDSD